MPLAPDPPPPVWRAPVAPIAVVRRYREAAPYSAGGHRGIDLRSTPGGSVRAPCAGRVTFRGSVAGGPPTVTIDCGRWRATVQRVVPAVRAGEAVGRGDRLGVAVSHALDLSARRPDGRYIDPEPLLRAAAPPPTGPVGAPRRRDRPRPGGPARPGSTTQPTQRPAQVADRALVTHQGASGAGAVAAEPITRVDRPLGVAGLGVMALVVALWSVAGWRGRRHGPKRARHAVLTRVRQ